MTRRLTSVQNPRIKQFRKLHRARERRQMGLTIVEGPGAVTAALQAGAAVEAILVVDDNAFPVPDDVREVLVDRHVLEAVAGTDTPRGPLAILRIPEPDVLRTAPTLVLWETAEPGNVGTLIRSAAAFGFDVAVGRGTADPWSPKCLRAGAGAHFAVRMSRTGSVGDLRHASLRPVALVPSGGTALRDMEHGAPMALLVGNEAHGLGADVVEECDQSLTISTEDGVESLNVAAAGAIAMHWLFGR